MVPVPCRLGVKASEPTPSGRPTSPLLSPYSRFFPNWSATGIVGLTSTATSY